MADNTTLPGTGTGTANIVVATRKVTYSGDSVDAQVVGTVIFGGSDDAKTVADIIPISAALDSTGTGVAAVGIVAQLDDTSTAAVTENQFAAPRLSSRRAFLTEGTGPATATTAGTQVASSATSVTLLSSNALRRGFLFYNGSTSVANVLFGTTASATSFSVYMAPNATYEMVGVNVYSGRIDAIWTTANGNMQVTEW